MKYKKGAREFYSENSLNADFYRDFLREKCGFQRFEWESCGYPQRFPEGKQSAFSFLSDEYFPVLSASCNLHRRRTGETELCRKLSTFLRKIYADISGTSAYDRQI